MRLVWSQHNAPYLSADIQVVKELQHELNRSGVEEQVVGIQMEQLDETTGDLHGLAAEAV